MDAFSIFRQSPPLIVWVAIAGQPLVQASGGREVTEEFFDNDKNVCSRSEITPFYDFIHGEPYAKWY